MTHVDVQTWLDRYIEAWKSYDPAAIGDLFAQRATYRYHPWDAPIVGRDAIVRDWLAPDGDAAGRDAPGTYDAHYEPYAVDGDRAVAVGHSDYFAPDGTVERRYHNVYLLAFDGDGRCTDLTEVYLLEG
jgi:hypothetical protein